MSSIVTKVINTLVDSKAKPAKEFMVGLKHPDREHFVFNQKASDQLADKFADEFFAQSKHVDDPTLSDLIVMPYNRMSFTHIFGKDKNGNDELTLFLVDYDPEKEEVSFNGLAVGDGAMVIMSDEDIEGDLGKQSTTEIFFLLWLMCRPSEERDLVVEYDPSYVPPKIKKSRKRKGMVGGVSERKLRILLPKEKAPDNSYYPQPLKPHTKIKHRRRAHLRRLRDGRVIRVRSSWAGDSTKGTLKKTYELDA